MSKLRWYRSLYWRMALGLFAFLVLMLTAQAALFVWMINETAGSMPARSPRRLAGLVASDLTVALATTPDLDLGAYVREQYGHVFQPFVVVMRNGTISANHDDVPVELQDAIAVETARLAAPRTPGSDRRGPPPGGAPPADRAWESAPVFIAGDPAGRVAVLGRFPRERFWRELGPIMLSTAVGVLVVGMALVAVTVFGPARRRLREVQHAAERLGTGDTAARAPEKGGDEVTAVAHSFNRMADELERRADALEASDRARRQLLADVSHELMTPLTAMRGYIETLSMHELALPADTRAKYLAIIEDETHRLEHIVGDLLDIAKLETSGIALRHEMVTLQTVFDRVRARHGREAATRQIDITSVIGPGADAVMGDADRLEQALQNLVANALRHTPDAGRITLTSSRRGEQIVLRVQDNGSGIPDEHLPHIFDRFYKADSSRRAAGGSGLGLSIVKAIVEGHGGTITARNESGAVFEVTLPAVAAMPPR
jgi:signal transduction histidine kinase